jgi:hypothetical protein
MGAQGGSERPLEVLEVAHERAHLVFCLRASLTPSDMLVKRVASWRPESAANRRAPNAGDFSSLRRPKSRLEVDTTPFPSSEAHRTTTRAA